MIMTTDACASRGGCVCGNATHILEEANYGVYIPHIHGSTDLRIGRKLQGNRVSQEQHKETIESGQSK